MAQHLTAPGSMAAWCCALLLAGLWGAGASRADALPDPTRPPALLLAPAQGAAPAGPVLQSVIISGRDRRALINGRMVRPGDKVGDAVVVRIREGAVVLRSGRALQTVKLFPGVEKRPVAAAKDGGNENQ